MLAKKIASGALWFVGGRLSTRARPRLAVASSSMAGPSETTVPKPTTSENLVIVRAGPNSLHPHWFTPEEAKFDLLVAAYNPHAPSATGEWRIDVPGTKVAGFGKLFDLHPEIFDRYQRIALIDDDIMTNSSDLNSLFRLGQEFQLEIWQPSLSHDSFFTYAITVQNRLYILRYTDYVEMMCPFFKASALRNIKPLFSEGYESGMDLIWSEMRLANSRKLAIIDAISVKHTRPVGKLRTDQGFDAVEGYIPVIHAFLKKKNLTFRYPAVIGGILNLNGIKIGRKVTSISQILLVKSVGKTPHSLKYIGRALYHHFGFGAGKRARVTREDVRP